MHRHNSRTGRARSRKLASALWAVPAGVAGAALCAGVAQAAEGVTDGGFSFAISQDQAQTQAYIRTAQLEWLFGGRRTAPQEQRAPSAGMGEGSRHQYVPQRDSFGNVTYQRVRSSDQPKRTPKIDAKNDRIRHAVAQKLRSAPPAPPANGPLLITVSLAKQQLTLYDQGVPVATSPVSSGSRGRETPTGVYSILQKQYFHRSNMYSSAPMPYMQRITWSGIALHGGELPGYPASHGCIRLPENFAIRLWGTTQPGVRVIVTQNEVKPFEISHPVLFKPKAQQAAPEAAPEIAPDVTPQVAPLPVPLPPQKDAPVPEPVKPMPAPQANADAPQERADASDLVGTAPASLLEEIANTVPVVTEITIVRGGQVKQLPARPAEVSANGMRAERIAVMRGGQPVEYQIVDMPPLARDSAVTASPVAARAAEPDTFADAGDVMSDELPGFALPDLGQMPAVLAYAGNDFMQVARLQRRAEAEPQQAEPAEASPPVAKMLRAGPVSVYISRRQQRIYVRKGFESVFDAPVTVARGDTPIGTHVFTANALIEDGKAFRWSAITVPDGTQSSRRAAADNGAAARSALDRIQLSPDVVSRISEIMEPGATLIVTDKGPGRAQSPDNDFSVVTR